KQRHMVEKVHRAFEELLNNYVKAPKIENYIVTPSLEDDAGTFGCLALAKKADLHVN
ncbi:MAG: ROK family protein, partial [Tetragenococcus koreensis]|nr:ROK family protein [Tetragenococcus koreensis]